MLPLAAAQKPVAARRLRVCAMQKEQSTSGPGAMLAVGLSLSVALCPMVNPPPVAANSYSDRVAAMEQRRKLLQETKEKALGESGDNGSSANSYLESMKSSLTMKIPELPQSSAPEEPEEPAAAPEPRGNLFDFTKSFTTEGADSKPAEAQAEPSTPPAPKLSFSRPSPPAKTAPKPAEAEPPVSSELDDSVPWWEKVTKLAESTSTSAPSKSAQTPPTPEPAPAPAPAFTLAPKPAPAPPVSAPAPAPRPVVEAKKAEEPKKSDQSKAAATQSKKRRGPLPMFLAQFLLLAAYGGGIYAVLFKSGDIGKVFESLQTAATEKVKALQADNASSAAK